MKLIAKTAILAFALAAGLCGCTSGYLVSQVSSGTVGRDVMTLNRYRIVSSEVVRLDDFGWFWDSKIRPLVRKCAIGESAFPEFVEMYAGVFSNDPSAVPIRVLVTASGRDKDGNVSDCSVEVTNAESGESLGKDGFSAEYRFLSNGDIQRMGVPQSIRGVSVRNAYRKTVLEGYAGAVVAVLEKKENEGKRGMTHADPPAVKEWVSPLEKTF